MLPTLEIAELPADAVEVGRIVDAWGIKGWFKVLPHSAQPEALFSSKRWFIQPSGPATSTPKTGAFRLAIREAKDEATAAGRALSAEIASARKERALWDLRQKITQAQAPAAQAGFQVVEPAQAARQDQAKGAEAQGCGQQGGLKDMVQCHLKRNSVISRSLAAVSPRT